MPITDSASFKYKSGITGKVIEYNNTLRINNAQGDQTPNPDYNANKIGTKEIKIIVPLRHLSKFRGTIAMPLINCEVSLTLTFYNKCVLTDLTTQDAAAAPGGNPVRPATAAPTGATFKITDCKLYVPVVTLSAENGNQLPEQLKTGFKRTIKWNKYRSEMTNQTKNNNLNHLIDPTVTKVNRLFVLSFENGTDRTSFEMYYVPKIDIKDFNVLIDQKSFFGIHVKNKEEAYEQIIEMSKNND